MYLDLIMCLNVPATTTINETSKWKTFHQEREKASRGWRKSSQTIYHSQGSSIKHIKESHRPWCGGRGLCLSEGFY